MWSRGLSKAADQANPGIKESHRWIEGYERVAELAQRCPDHRLIYTGDRESDIDALLRRAQQLDYPADLLIRAQHNRALGDDTRLWDAIDQQSPLTRITFTQPRKPGEQSRKVIQDIKVVTVHAIYWRGTATCSIFVPHVPEPFHTAVRAVD